MFPPAPPEELWEPPAPPLAPQLAEATELPLNQVFAPAAVFELPPVPTLTLIVALIDKDKLFFFAKSPPAPPAPPQLER
jgi:hypothetical protein